MGHCNRFRENGDLPPWQGSAAKKKLPFFNARASRALMMCKIMRSRDAQSNTGEWPYESQLVGGWPLDYLHRVVEKLNSGLPRTTPDTITVEDLNQGIKFRVQCTKPLLGASPLVCELWIVLSDLSVGQCHCIAFLGNELYSHKAYYPSQTSVDKCFFSARFRDRWF